MERICSSNCQYVYIICIAIKYLLRESRRGLFAVDHTGRVHVPHPRHRKHRVNTYIHCSTTCPFHHPVSFAPQNWFLRRGRPVSRYDHLHRIVLRWCSFHHCDWMEPGQTVSQGLTLEHTRPPRLFVKTCSAEVNWNFCERL